MDVVKKITIEIKELRVFAYHGVTLEEKKTGCWFLIDCAFDYPAQRALVTDDLNDTVNYAEIVELIRQEMFITSSLIEHAAARIVKTLTQRFPLISNGMLRLSKLSPPACGELTSAAVTLRWL